jgi:hypothetical protein
MYYILVVCTVHDKFWIIDLPRANEVRTRVSISHTKKGREGKTAALSNETVQLLLCERQSQKIKN